MRMIINTDYVVIIRYPKKMIIKTKLDNSRSEGKNVPYLGIIILSVANIECYHALKDLSRYCTGRRKFSDTSLIFPSTFLILQLAKCQE